VRMPWARRRQVVINPADPNLRVQVRKAILGSAYETTGVDETTAGQRADQAWQMEALQFRNRLGEIRYASDFYARSLRRLKLFAGTVGDDGKISQSTNPDSIRLVNAIQDPGGGRQVLLGKYGQFMFTCGECQLLYLPERVEDGTRIAESWEMLSIAEIQKRDGRDVRFRLPGGTPDQLPDGYRLYRLWQRDPIYSSWADAPMRSVLDLCEELAILTLVVRARALNRLAGNGILFVPNDITVTPRGPVPDEDPKEDPVLAEIIKALLAPIEDIGAASMVAPLLMRGDPAAGKEIRHISVRDVQEVFPENALREQTIRRLAISLDMPAEALTGIGDVNHWGGWQIERESWRHAEPIAQQLCDDLSAAYLRPTLAQGSLGPEAVAREVVAMDAAAITTNPDRGADAADAFDRGAIGYRAYRDALGWDNEDAPAQDEIDLMLLFLNGAPAPDDTVEAGGDEGEAGPPEGDDAGDDGAPADDTPDTASLLGLAEATILRHREAAGARLRSASTGGLDDVPNSLVAATVGANGGDATALVRLREPMFETVATRMGLDRQAADALALLVAHHAARTLYDTHPAPFPATTVRAVIDRRVRT
jgi:hypothetical protein